ncbi:MAG: hypothetical protein RBG13Loki_4260 [Promethearchaeota archaeon CR_4]|nr:MAG: hypothetical protein RBG13Loki_4260 [Candidatus Lokiarchaeota archaeon CR_4]
MVIDRKYGFVKEDYTEAIKYIMGNTNPKFIPDNTLPPQYTPLYTKKEVKEMKPVILIPEQKWILPLQAWTYECIEWRSTKECGDCPCRVEYPFKNGKPTTHEEKINLICHFDCDTKNTKKFIRIKKTEVKPTMECPNCKNTIENNRGEKEVKFCPFCGSDIIGNPIGSAVEGYEYTIKRLEYEFAKAKQDNADLKRLHETDTKAAKEWEHEAEQLHELVATCESRNENLENQIAKLTQKGILWKCRRCVRKYGQCSHHYSLEGKREQGPSCQVPAKPPRVKLSKEDKRKQRQCASRKECRKVAGKNCLAATCTCFKEKPVTLKSLQKQYRKQRKLLQKETDQIIRSVWRVWRLVIGTDFHFGNFSYDYNNNNCLKYCGDELVKEGEIKNEKLWHAQKGNVLPALQAFLRAQLAKKEGDQ